jgi:hypothetical protein
MYRGVPYCFHLDIPYQKGVSSYLIITLCFHLLQLDIPLYAFIDNISCTKFIVNETYFNNLVLP